MVDIFQIIPKGLAVNNYPWNIEFDGVNGHGLSLNIISDNNHLSAAFSHLCLNWQVT